MTFITPQPSAVEIAGWENQRGQLTGQYNANAARLALSQQQAGTDFDINSSQLAKKYATMKSKIGGAFNARGLYHSGLHTQGMQDANDAQAQDTQNMQAAYYKMLQQIGMEQTNNASQSYGALMGVAQSEAARRQDLATQITSLL